MHTWFQNLNDNHPPHRHWLNFRGSVGRTYDKTWFKYELHTGPALRFTMDALQGKTKFSFGIVFFTLYLTIYGVTVPFIPKGDKYSDWGREYGFYWFEWTFWAFFGRDPMSGSSKDPWYYQIVIHPLDLLFGKTKHFENERLKTYSPVLFEFRGKPYQMDEIKITQAYWFKTRIPFGLWHRRVPRMHLDIKKPPGFAGKGENSYDCGDDATYGTCQMYKGPPVHHSRRDEIFEYCLKTYCDDVMKSIKRYGRCSGDEVAKDESGFRYIGQPRDENAACEAPK